LVINQSLLRKLKDQAYGELNSFDTITGHKMLRLYFSILGWCLKTGVYRQWTAGVEQATKRVMQGDDNLRHCVWSDAIVLLSPTRNQGFGFFQGKEDLAIEQFVALLAVE
jgi:hypothetical protein